MIYNFKEKKNFTQITNSIINNKTLSVMARMILIYALSKPKKWNLMSIDIINNFKEQRDAIRRGLIELEEEGYLFKYRVRNKKGRMLDAHYDVFNHPIPEDLRAFFLGELSRDGSANIGKPKVGFSNVGKPPLSNIYKDINNIENINNLSDYLLSKKEKEQQIFIRNKNSQTTPVGINKKEKKIFKKKSSLNPPNPLLILKGKKKGEEKMKAKEILQKQNKKKINKEIMKKMTGTISVPKQITFWQALLSENNYTASLSMTKQERGLLKNLNKQLDIPVTHFLEYAVVNWNDLKKKITWGKGKKTRLSDNPTFKDVYFSKEDILNILHKENTQTKKVHTSKRKEVNRIRVTKIKDIPKDKFYDAKVKFLKENGFTFIERKGKRND